MRNEFLYVFGYESPEERASNRDYEGDFESTGFFWIIANSEDEALSWGQELSKWYTRLLFGENEEQQWQVNWFASWIENSPDKELEKAAKQLRPITVGEFPDFENVKLAFSD
ncbi:MAG: hypothetical protein OEM02_12575 [Desulfobulbaceae bacterium]|nr:hypothetical protein [Desulfobulbaceae bacterium]